MIWLDFFIFILQNDFIYLFIGVIIPKITKKLAMTMICLEWEW